MAGLRADLRYGLRALARTPGVTAAAVVSLALGIGANTTVFTWARAILLRPFPAVADSDSLVALNTSDANEGYVSLSYPRYRDLRDRNTKLAGLLVMRQAAIGLGAGDTPELVFGQLVSGNYFDVLGLKPERGRLITPDDDRVAGGHPVLVISHALWQRSFAGDPAIVGRSASVNGRPYTIVGVAPEAFKGTVAALVFDAWIPVAMHEQVQPGGNRLEQRGNRWLDALARLKPGVSRAEAEAELNAIAAQLNLEHRDDPPGRSVVLSPLWRAPRSAAQVMGPVLGVLGGVVVLVLLIACANVAGLLVARGVARRREIAIRLSLGARRRDLVRQLLVESALVALAGGALGALCAVWGAGLLQRLVPPVAANIGLGVKTDAAALAFALAVSMMAALLAGLVPAWQASRPDTQAALKEESNAAGTPFRRARLRQALVVGQVGLSLVLLVGTGLLLRSLQAAQNVDLGFNPKGVLLASLQLFTGGYERERGLAFYRDLVERAQALPGVTAASLVRRPPMGFGGASSTTIRVDGYEAPVDKQAWGYYNVVGPGYLAAVQTALRAGRDISAQDDERAAKVAVVNETMARRYWPGREALGGRFQFGSDWLTVVGVARDTLWRDFGEKPAPLFYVPAFQSYAPDLNLLVRTDGDLAPLATSVRDALRQLDPRLPVYNLRGFETQLEASTFQWRLGSQVMGLLGLLGLTLSAVGLYGVLAFAVAQRTREIGVRMALGGVRSDIFALIVRQGLAVAGLGLALGTAAALAGARLLSRLLVGVGPIDPPSFAAALAVLAGAAFLACAIPARRATRIDPLRALRCD